MTRRRRANFTPRQQELVAELRGLAKARPDVIQVPHSPKLGAEGEAVVTLVLNTRDLPKSSNGLPISESEAFTLRIGRSLLAPPTLDVEHYRFLGFPHVLQGHRICLFLDPSREWHPSFGMSGFLDRFWDWLRDAATGKFDAKTSMYHAVGGVLHLSPKMPTIVIRDDTSRAGHIAATLCERTPDRLDLVLSTDQPGSRMPLFSLDFDLPMGASASFSELLAILDSLPFQVGFGVGGGKWRKALPFTIALTACALRNSEGSPQYFALSVPHPRGGAAHLLGGRIPARAADALRSAAKGQGAISDLDLAKLSEGIGIEWCRMSDERPEVTVRRDHSRPVSGFLGKTVHVWGCGGLGSWIAEFAARAGADEITVCDPGIVTGGLLVRQNYTEGDIGVSKAEALAARLRSLRDDLSVKVASGMVPEDFNDCLGADLVIDATVSNAITEILDVLAAQSGRKSIIAQVATDTLTGCLGLVSICAPDSMMLPSIIDRVAGNEIQGKSELECFHRLWQQPAAGTEFVPTRGCSVPTFHGSAADLASVAGALTSLVGKHLQASDSVSGTHVISLPYAGGAPHYFSPARATG